MNVVDEAAVRLLLPGYVPFMVSETEVDLVYMRRWR